MKKLALILAIVMVIGMLTGCGGNDAKSDKLVVATSPDFPPFENLENGEVVGVVAAIATTTGKSEGVAFAIPINLALNVLKLTIDGGGWSRSHMGVELESATRADFQGADWPIKSGSKIVGVNANSPAERAGLRRGDVVVEFDGEAIEDEVHLARLIAIADVSREANVKFLRGARLLETSARLERPTVK